MYFIIFYLLIIVFVILLARCIYLILDRKNRCISAHDEKTKCKTLIVIGSGGHTTEIVRIVKRLNPTIFTPRIYVVAESDDKSNVKIHETEGIFSSKGEYRIVKIPRSRKVHQSYISSVFTTLYAILYSIPVVLLHKPELILCNGPGTCIPICLVGFLSRMLYLSDNVIVFFESICRVKTLSLSGKILQFFADRIIVQWPELKLSCKQAIFIEDLKL
ncbi:UDP-N-acetylglucosamine transferase subunit ALG14 homolog [Planococcus citri]|uniref:UDP-N-acetylglucosamine transferase subunit ALG14 homolog n=1 Tax=Planococcus citri TaxID=170843 RepID=UPI0031F928CA